MRPLTTTRAIGLLAAGAMLIAACGGGAATTAPTQVAATTPAATSGPVATDAPSTGLPGFSFVLPSFIGDQQLEDMFPDEIGGEALQVISMTGDEFLGDGSTSPEIASVLGDLGKTTADLSVAFGGNVAVTIVAFRVKGVDAGTLFNAFKEAQTETYTTESASYGGKSVTKLTPSDGEISYISFVGDVMFVVGGETVTEATLNEAFAALP